MSVAIVTGGARGLGKAFTESLLKRGNKVCFCDIDVAEGEKTQTEFIRKFGERNVNFQQCDVRKDQDFTAFFNEVLQNNKSVDIMVNSAGIVDEKEWRNCVDINLNGMIHGSLLAMDHMKLSNGGKGGVILNVSSLGGVMPVAWCPVYAATKHGIAAFSRSWALHPDIRKNGIRIACLAPSFANTDIIKVNREKIKGLNIANAMIKKYEIMTTDRVVEAFEKTIDDTTNNGKVMVVTPDVMNYFTFHDSNL